VRPTHDVAQQQQTNTKEEEELGRIGHHSELGADHFALKTLLLTFPTARIGVTYWQFYLRFVALGVKLTGKNQ
jgi:hypothetical protein